MGTADLMRHNGKDIPECYAAISERSKCPTALFTSRTKLTDYATINYDRVGILFEYRSYYYTILEPIQGKNAAFKEGIHRGWLHESHLGIQLVCEWESIPKMRVGQDGIGATGSTQGWWLVHSRIIMSLRNLIVGIAKNLEKSRRLVPKAPTEGQFTRALDQQFARVVDAHYGTLRIQEKQLVDSMESAWEEYMKSDDEEAESRPEKVVWLSDG